MHLIIPASLPPASIAADLLPHVQAHCPALVRIMERLAAQSIEHAPEESGCTAQEFLELVQHGYTGHHGHTFGAGLAAWRAGMTQATEPVWIADLCSVAIGREGAQLAIPESIQLEPHEADALFEAAHSLWTDSAISVLPLEPGRWRVWLPAGAQLNSISPAAVSTLAIADWWPQHESLKIWRKLLNEVQMLWHEHPVNTQRLERGLNPINSLWIYGGSPGWKPAPPSPEPVYYDALTAAFLQGDWSQWIAQLPKLSTYLDALPLEASLTLLGERKIVELHHIKRRWWQYFSPASQQKWTHWWTHQK